MEDTHRRLSQLVQCNLCGKHVLPIMQRNHTAVHFKDLVHFDCIVKSCDAHFEYYEQFEVHYEQEHSAGMVSCKYCDKKYKNLNGFRVHFCDEHKEEFGIDVSFEKVWSTDSAAQSDESGEETNSRSLSANPILQTFTPESIPEQMEEEEPDPESLIMTDLTVSPTESLKCIPCGMTFPDQRLFVFHKSFHSESEPFTCTVCQGRFDDKYEFTAHLYILEHSSIRRPTFE
uniref:C2H2-type domain-containing protein n=1 Tax=Caenorhabditis tropicalis TaxID=1561998 RepID=A0A1I7UQJ5_9PELO